MSNITLNHSNSVNQVKYQQHSQFDKNLFQYQLHLLQNIPSMRINHRDLQKIKNLISTNGIKIFICFESIFKSINPFQEIKHLKIINQIRALVKQILTPYDQYGFKEFSFFNIQKLKNKYKFIHNQQNLPQQDHQIQKSYFILTVKYLKTCFKLFNQNALNKEQLQIQMEFIEKLKNQIQQKYFSPLEENYLIYLLQKNQIITEKKTNKRLTQIQCILQDQELQQTLILLSKPRQNTINARVFKQYQIHTEKYSMIQQIKIKIKETEHPQKQYSCILNLEEIKEYLFPYNQFSQENQTFNQFNHSQEQINFQISAKKFQTLTEICEVYLLTSSKENPYIFLRFKMSQNSLSRQHFSIDTDSNFIQTAKCSQFIMDLKFRKTQGHFTN